MIKRKEKPINDFHQWLTYSKSDRILCTVYKHYVNIKPNVQL